MNRHIASLITLAALTLSTSSALASKALPDNAVMFKSPTCQCCDHFAKHLQDNGIAVKVVPMDDMATLKDKA